MAADYFQQLEAVHPWHFQIENQQIRPDALDQERDLKTVGHDGQADRHFPGVDRFFVKLAQRRVVFGDHDRILPPAAAAARTAPLLALAQSLLDRLDADAPMPARGFPCL